MSLEQIRSDPGALGSEETHQVGKEQLNAVLRPTELLGQLLGYSTFHLLGDLSKKIILLWFDNTCVLCQVVHGKFLTIFLVNVYKFSLILPLEKVWAVKTELSFLLLDEKSGYNKTRRTSFCQKQLTEVFFKATKFNNRNTIVLSFLLFLHFPWRETKLFTRQVKVQIVKSSLIIILSKEKMQTLAGKKHLSPIPSLIYRVFSIFGRSNPSNVHIKVLIPALTQ